MTSIEWPPPYKVRKHKRARYVKLRMSPPRGLEITVPYRFNLRDIPSILEENKIWITKQFAQLQLTGTDELPTSLSFHALNESWKIYYEPCKAKVELIERPGQELIVVGVMQDKEIGKTKLLAWIRNKSRIYLSEQLARVSHQTQLPYSHLTIRDQQTVWGSCTVKKSISLNYKLIFLPKHLTDYVMIHELCHTKYLNHSSRFWELVEKFDPDWKQHKRELRHANQFMPKWV